jgi:hypothetical protein
MRSSNRWRNSSRLSLLLLLAWACNEPTEPPRSPNPDRPGLIASRTTTPALCEKNWLYMNDGEWTDKYEWLPSGAPTPTDEVCLTAGTTGNESYRITVSPDSAGHWGTADSIYVGPGADVTLDLRTGMVVYEELVIDAGATLTILADSFIVNIRDVINNGTLVFDGGRLTFAGVLENRGTLTMRDSWLMPWTRRLNNTGLLQLDDATVEVDTLINSGDLHAVNDPEIRVVRHMEMNGGRVLGSGTLTVTEQSSARPAPTLVWSGGTLPLRSGSTGRASLVLRDVDLTLNSGAGGGAVDFAYSGSVAGHVGPTIDLSAFSTLWLRPPTGAPPNQSVVVDGTVSGYYVSSANPVVLNGVLHNSSWFMAPTFVNNGQILIDNDLTFDGSGGYLFRNRGTVSGGELELRDGTMVAEPSGTVDAAIRVTSGAKLLAAGTLSDVRVDHGTLAPEPGIATLTVGSLALSDSSTVALELAGISQFDRLAVLGDASFAGTLEVSQIGGFAGGFCGQLLTPIKQNNSATGTTPGHFRSVRSFPSGVPQGWRARVESDSVILAGYDPTQMLNRRPQASTVAEGGQAVTTDVCLGGPRPASPVTFSVSAVRGQLSSTPNSLTFTSANFDLPQRLRVTAVDDAVSEGPHGDSLSLTTSTVAPPYAGTRTTLPLSIVDNEPGVDLGVAIVFSDPPPTVNQAFELTVRVTNYGPGASTGSVLSVPNLAGATLQNSYGSTCTMSGATLQCPLGALASGAWTEVTLVLRAGATPGTFPGSFRIRGRDWDNVTANDSVPWVLTVN